MEDLAPGAGPSVETTPRLPNRRTVPAVPRDFAPGPRVAPPIHWLSVRHRRSSLRSDATSHSACVRRAVLDSSGAWHRSPLGSACSGRYPGTMGRTEQRAREALPREFQSQRTLAIAPELLQSTRPGCRDDPLEDARPRASAHRLARHGFGRTPSTNTSRLVR